MQAPTYKIMIVVKDLEPAARSRMQLLFATKIISWLDILRYRAGLYYIYAHATSYLWITRLWKIDILGNFGAR